MDKRLIKSDKHKKKISETLKQKHKEGILSVPWKGKERSKEHSSKISISHKGKHYSPETEFKKGKIPPTKDNPELVKRIQEKRMLHIKEIGEKISKSRKGQRVIWGENHWNWQGGKSFEIYPIEFIQAKKIVRELYRNVCQICFEKGTDIHHIDYNKQNNDFSNLICLCRHCHIKTNYNRNKWIEYFKLFKYILITGAGGMIGRELIEQLSVNPNIRIKQADIKWGIDLTDKNIVNKIMSGIDDCYSLFGIKGNPKKTKERPVDFMAPMLQGDTNIILACGKYKVKKLLYTSSIAVENPESDKYPAWAKLTGEVLIDAMRIQYPETKYCIVRPANVYGRFDNFENSDAMVLTSLINKAMKDGKLILDKKGAMQERDFINAKDVARGMIEVIDKMPKYPIKLCSGKGVQINQAALAIQQATKCKLEYKDLNLTLGPDRKVMYLNWDFKPEISLEEGIKEVIEWRKK